ncbi:MAG: carboxypeptidase regulatory-like domain-containing protein [Deltaproteobacteria bacterium]|nr:carboxypeptidase regulatory-like domain-containing protein [Deltaproteobacteria bacterium]
MSAPTLRVSFIVASAIVIAACSSRRTEPSSSEGDRQPASEPASDEEHGGTQSPPTTTAQAPAGVYTAIDVQNGGNIVGHVRWSGPRPPMEPLPVTKNPEICGTTAPFPALTIGEGDGVQFTVVYLEGITRGRALPQIAADAMPVMDQTSCQYTPHVMTVGLRQQFGIRNSDPTLHNVHGFFANDESWFNLAQPTRGMTTRRNAERAGPVRIVCDAGHTWMLGYVHVFPHPYHAVTDASGAFRIEGVPPGSYTVKAWHEGWRVTGTTAGRPVFGAPVVLTQSVTVAAGRDATTDFQLSDGA